MSKGNIKLAGNGEISEGEYDEIKIMGNATSNGPIKADVIHVMGGARFKGDIEVKECVICGNAHIVGNMTAEKLKVSGDLNLKGDCQIENLKVDGSSNIAGVMECNNVVVSGNLVLTEDCQIKTLKVYGGVTAESDLLGDEITIEGKINCKGLLSGEKISLHSYADSYCQEIGATKLIVEKPFYHFLWFGRKNILECNLIEADDISLEYTKAKIVRGKQVILNKQCDIDTVEYGEKYSKGEACTVREVTKVD